MARSASTSADPIDPARFRSVLACVPTSVVAVTSIIDGAPVGMTIGSFVSVSLQPPLVAFCADDGSTTWPQVRDTRAPFCVNVLSSDQAALSQRLATSDPGKFDGLDWHPTDRGLPVLDGALAWFDCDVDTIHRAGDHEIVIGRVRSLDQQVDTGSPLAFYNRMLGTVTPVEADA